MDAATLPNTSRQRPPLWAKLDRDDTGAVCRWHSLLDHSADVAAVFEAILRVPVVDQRLARLADVAVLPEIWRSRLAVYVALHDLGKANRGFQARWRQDAPVKGNGHVMPAVALMGIHAEHRTLKQLSQCLLAALPLEDMMGWGGIPHAFLAVLAHHGRPVESKFQDELETWRLWKPFDGHDPVGELRPLGEAVRRHWFPEAFSTVGPALPEAPKFWHAIAGLTMLADWLGSDKVIFPFSDGISADRISGSRETARSAIDAIGFNPARFRRSFATPPNFAQISKFPPRPAQVAVGDALGQLVILESETGSGKTEAALYRFARLFAAGEVDGLYFALPTRVAAKGLEKRVREAVDRLFDGQPKPAVVLAVPGYAKADGIGVQLLPGFEVQWDDNPDEAVRMARWSAEAPKRFLAGTIAVGTIDQALLGAITVKHAHMRAACLLRHLLVVDEVHASDTYMEHVLLQLLRNHTAAGGHALLLSATLGSAARSRLLGDDRPPSCAEAEALPYPGISTSNARRPVHLIGSEKTKAVALTLDPSINDPAEIAGTALAAARQGAKVLVIRNLQRDAVATTEALFAQAPDDPVLFRCKGVPTLHHGRFAREDRELLDEAVDIAMGRNRGTGGLVLIGTQTLEISLDIDADLMITDLCPADVLLQRLGRLHRHDRKERPVGFETPRATVLCPLDLAVHLARGKARHGLGGDYGPYTDLIGLEATRRLIADHPTWTIPAMNRMLVERTTHPDALDALTLELGNADEGWIKAGNRTEGRYMTDRQTAARARLRWDLAFDDANVLFPADGERVATRLGARDLAVAFDGVPVIGPFGEAIRRLSIPHHWLRGIDLEGDLTPKSVEQIADSAKVSFLIQAARFDYTHLGLNRRSEDD